jgi:hypothetical protein
MVVVVEMVVVWWRHWWWQLEVVVEWEEVALSPKLGWLFCPKCRSRNNIGTFTQVRHYKLND